MKIIYLHVPHTCGRMIKRDLWNKKLLKNIICVHNQNDIINCYSTESYDLIYFVLREPLDRIIGEYKHYSKALMNDMKINHLEPQDVKNIDLNNILEYCSLETNKNVYCKFLLLKKNFNVPINDIDYKNIIKLVEENRVKYDKYTFPLENLPVLSNIVSQNILPVSIFPNVKKCDISLDKYICDRLKYMNNYDFMLYDHLGFES